ncbi:MAG: hypothetical protein E6G85_17960 [Alphaproteobacteria bacterium]|nr:MAG: hypothetical protein E6G85_17960 [Alphaproteobacteria bacterium]
MTNEDEIPRLYLDANVFIYAIEGSADIADPLRQLFDLFRANRAIGVTSELTLAEVLPRVSGVRRRSYLNMIVLTRSWVAIEINRNPFRLPDSSLCRLAVETTQWVFRAITRC